MNKIHPALLAAPHAADDAITVPVAVAIPRQALTLTAAPPDTLSQKNVLASTGIPPRLYLEELRAQGFPLPVARLGKLRIVDRCAFVAWPRSKAAPQQANTRNMAD